MDDARVVRQLAAALPEAFAGRDVGDELPYGAMGTARRWIEDRALKRRFFRVVGVRPEAEAPLARLLAYVESLAGEDDDARTLVSVELFEGAVWVDAIADRLGPRTRELVR
jgi:hypothetical protein